MFNLIFSQIYPGDHKLISSAFNQALPKLYAFSMMWTLNARREIQADDVDLAFSHGANLNERKVYTPVFNRFGRAYYEAEIDSVTSTLLHLIVSVNNL